MRARRVGSANQEYVASPMRVSTQVGATAGPAKYQRLPSKSTKMALTPWGLGPTTTCDGRFESRPDVLIGAGAASPEDPTVATGDMGRGITGSTFPTNVGGPAAWGLRSAFSSAVEAVESDGIVLPAVPARSPSRRRS